jgi:membrane protease YdiL (CAAX protease family)
LIGTIALAAAFWFVTFYLSWSSFWVKISISAAALALLALRLQPDILQGLKIDAGAILAGILSATLLYGIFWLGKLASTSVFGFAGEQIGGIYAKGTGTSPAVISLLLFCVTGPSEEIYWRGYLQRNLVERFGEWKGYLAATCIYAGVHVWSLNFMLIGAAWVAGAFWGLMYLRFRNLTPVIISHSVWSTVIFAVFPMH